MFRTLYAKLAVSLVVLLFAIGILYILLSQAALQRQLEELNQQLNRDLAENLVADRNLVREGRLNEKALKETLQQYMSINPSIEIYVLDLKGQIISYSADPKKIKRKFVDLGPIKSFLDMEEPYPLLGDDPRSHDRRKAFSVTSIPSRKNPEGYLYVVLRGEQYDFAEQMAVGSLFFRFSSWAMIISLAVGLCAGLLIFHFIVRRLQHLSVQMQEFEDHNFEVPIQFDHKQKFAPDEIDQLGIRFEQLARHIGQQIEKLREQDALRRELVAQISHDLRTPLAAILGYLESLQMKDSNLSTEKRSEFINVALRQGRHLNGLVNELFELASLDARERKPSCESFAPAELVYDTAQKHKLKAEQKQIDLKISSPPELSFAYGDVELTERVLDNLLDNAFSATPVNGEIVIKLTETPSHVEITISDTGHGISEIDKPHIFKPFFRSQQNKGDRGHAGLGLAVAKRIMELQKGKLWFKSEQGKGATFVLSLPLSQSILA